MHQLIIEEAYISTSSYAAQNPDEVTFEKGVLLEVTMKGLDGWWSVRYKGQEGMAPSAYLEKYNQSLQTTSAMPTQLVSTPSEASATSKPATRAKSSALTKSKTILDADNKKTKESRTFTGKLYVILQQSLYEVFVSSPAKTAPPPRKESIKVYSL